MSLPQQKRSPKKEEQKIPAGLSLISTGLPGVAAPGTAAENTNATVATASSSFCEILNFARKSSGRPIQMEGASPPQYVSIAP
eukprot:CAMPEP_0194270576 /NCGR_PEP_ID=MMETSP0169-20130528/4541_1 /TAXON_ID=218684 /ORGANISM="Corethron pennatum, Strain L29A3" /LENGTH=82 /DNA_ID=CAMNT_0039012673 /DNA_START=263 /DNA_END=508 /DNA_ORIENTATION=+